VITDRFVERLGGCKLSQELARALAEALRLDDLAAQLRQVFLVVCGDRLAPLASLEEILLLPNLEVSNRIEKRESETNVRPLERHGLGA
jgi:predicted ATPase